MVEMNQSPLRSRENTPTTALAPLGPLGGGERVKTGNSEFRCSAALL